MSQPDQPPDGHLGALRLADALALLNSHAAAALAFEHSAALAVARFVRHPARELFRWLTQLWVSRFGPLTTRIDPITSSAFTVELTRRIRAIPIPDPTPLLTRQAQQALDLGLRQGAVELGVTRRVESEVAPSTLRLIGEVTAKVGQRYRDSERLLVTHPIETHADAVTALAPTQAAAGDVEGSSRFITNTALNQGLHDTAAEHGADLLWFAEKDACVTCAALSGEVVGYDESFDESLTFGRKAAPWYSVGGPLRPPRHKNCRCRCEPYLGHDEVGGGGPVSLPMALKREAARSVIKGWALESEPDSVRRDAAARLLARGGAGLPKSVQARARRQVESKDKFKRPVPTGDG